MTLLSAMVLFGSSQASGTPVVELRGRLDALAPKHFRGLLYVERDGRELFFHGVGRVDPVRNGSFTRETGIEIGSIVKPFVHAAILRLASQGKLALSDSISKYFVGVPADKEAITLDMLRSHRSGFIDVFGGDYEPMPKEVLIRRLLSSRLLFTPGTKMEYSNAGYSMLAAVIEQVTGKGVEQHLAETQFLPLGMMRTGYVLPRWTKDQLVVGTDRRGRRWGSPLDRFWYPDGPTWNLRGNGGMLTNARELAKWGTAVHHGRLLSPAEYALFAPRLAEKVVPETAIWGALGGNGIFNCALVFLPKEKLTFVAFSADGRLEIENSLRELLPLIRRL